MGGFVTSSVESLQTTYSPTDLINKTSNDYSLRVQFGSAVAHKDFQELCAVGPVPRACHTATGYAYFRRAVTNSLETRMCAELHLAPRPDTWLWSQSQVWDLMF